VCGEDTKLYTLTIDGFKANFTGEPDDTDSYGYTTYYCEVELDDFDSIKVYTFKTSAECALTVTLWKDGKEVATVSSPSNEVESYDDDDDS
jgi:hypothetical protein